MLKRILLAVVTVAAVGMTAPAADAGIVVRRVAPVRRVAARTVLPPYPIARRAVVAPVVRPVVVAPVYRPVLRPAPIIVTPGIAVWGF